MALERGNAWQQVDEADLMGFAWLCYATLTFIKKGDLDYFFSREKPNNKGNLGKCRSSKV